MKKILLFFIVFFFISNCCTLPERQEIQKERKEFTEAVTKQKTDLRNAKAAIMSGNKEKAIEILEDTEKTTDLMTEKYDVCTDDLSVCKTENENLINENKAWLYWIGFGCYFLGIITVLSIMYFIRR